MEKNSVVCRKMRETDVPELAALERENFPTPWSAESLKKEVDNQLAMFLVAEYDNCVAGYAGMYMIGEEGSITNIVVNEKYRRRGIASAILKTLFEKSRENKIHNITLEVRVSNHTAIQLYEKFGFCSEGIRPGFYDFPKEDAMIMWYRERE